MRKQSQFPPGWDEARVRRVLEHYEAQSDEEAVAEDEASFEATTHTAMEVPVDLVPIAFVNFMGTAVWMVLFPAGVPAVRVLLSLTAAGLLVAFARRVVFHVRRALLTREELSFNPLSTARVMSRG